MRRVPLGIAVVALLVAALGITAVAGASHQEFATGEANLHPANGSGAKGHIIFADGDAGVAAEGTATGLQPSVGRYTSLVYDLGSVPGGPDLCEPTEPMPNMLVGTWSVDADGNGTLVQTNPSIPPLDSFDTVSIRDTTIDNGMGPDAVVACGQVALHASR